MNHRGPVSEKPSSELFTFDTAPSEAIQKAYNAKHKPLKADEILAQRSAVPGVDNRKRSRITDGIVEPSSKRQRGNWVSKKEVQRLKQVAARNGNNNLASRQTEDDNPGFDLWATIDTPAEEAEDLTISEYIPKPKPKVAPSTIRHKPISMTADGAPVTAIPNPKAGTSYNPAFEDWDKLLTSEGQKAVEAEQERLEAERKAAELQDRVNAAAQDVEDSDDGDESAWEGIESEAEASAANLRKKRPERKTPSQRNKAKRKKELERQAKHSQRVAERLNREAQTYISNTKSLVPSAPSDQPSSAIITTAATTADVDDSNRALRRRTLGKAPIPSAPLEVVLPDELQDSLRRLKPEGNLLNDRFRNLLVQGKMEARRPIVQPRKKRVKVTEKWRFKDFRVEV